MKYLPLIFSIFIAILPGFAQVEFITDSYFPADLEFKELGKISSEERFNNPDRLSGIENGNLISDVGFKDYAHRTYAVGKSGALSIEVVTLIDYRAAYSLLSLLRVSDIHEGTPGDAYSAGPGSIIFCHGRRWVRILGRNVPDKLLSRVASSVSNRMGEPRKKLPSLISHLPETGLQTGTLQYFPSTESFDSGSQSSSDGVILTQYEMEIAQARYFLSNSEGVLYLLKFPTPEMAEEYFNELSVLLPGTGSVKTYFRMSGPLLSVLEGSFSSDAAGSLLSSIQYSYSIQWIRDNESQYTVVWGIPVHILKTTVWSFFFVLVLCGCSILVGAGIAGFRLLLRRFLPQNPLDDPKRTEITRLKLP